MTALPLSLPSASPARAIVAGDLVTWTSAEFGRTFAGRVIIAGPVACEVRVVGLDTTSPLWGMSGIVRTAELTLDQA